MTLNISPPTHHKFASLASKSIQGPMVNTVVIGDKQYNLDTADPKEMHLYNQYKALEKKMIIAKLEYEQLDVAYQVFGQHLLRSINSKGEEDSKKKDD